MLCTEYTHYLNIPCTPGRSMNPRPPKGKNGLVQL